MLGEARCLKNIGPYGVIFCKCPDNDSLGGYMISKYLSILMAFSFLIIPAFGKSVEIMSFNVENLFDTSHDQGHADYEYLPFGHPAKNKGCAEIENDYFRGKCFKTDWNDSVLRNKLKAVTEVVFRGGRQSPDILGLVEVENAAVANMLADRLGYTKVLVTRGDDRRGINVALLVRESSDLKYLAHKEIKVSTPEMRKPTRNVLHVKFLLNGKKDLNVFVNHWPSQSNPSRDREVVAKKLLECIDDLRDQKSGQYIVVLGDFNVIPADDPNAITDVLLREETNLIDVEQRYRQSSEDRLHSKPLSSYYYKRGNNWNHLDRIIVSRNLFDDKNEDVDLSSFEIFAHPKYSKVVNNLRIPLRFEIKNGKTSGVSDHYPLSVKISL